MLFKEWEIPTRYQQVNNSTLRTKDDEISSKGSGKSPDFPFTKKAHLAMKKEYTFVRWAIHWLLCASRRFLPSSGHLSRFVQRSADTHW